MYQVYYYDDYDFNRNGIEENNEKPVLAAYPKQWQSSQFGQITQRKERVLNTKSKKWITEIYHHDYRGNLVYEQKAYGDFGNLIQERLFSLQNWNLKDSSSASFLGTNQTLVIANEHDHRGRIKNVYHSLNHEGLVHIYSYDYDEKGHIRKKKLGSTGSEADDFLQIVDYSYNIRGWLTRINNYRMCDSEIIIHPDKQDVPGIDPGGIGGFGGPGVGEAEILTNTESNDLFALSIYYENGHNDIQSDPQYNGNISEIIYREGCQANPKAYSFTYDHQNQLLSADYYLREQSEFENVSNFDVDRISYDANGNILSIRRKDGQGSTIDSLVYSYHLNNQLANVVDYADGSEGFISSELGTEYSFDQAGNLLMDENKAVLYESNYMNKPHLITNTEEDSLKYLYSATGLKLQRMSKYQDGSGHFTNYLGSFEFKDGDLSSIYFKEGRVHFEDEQSQYEYVIRDQLGNNRVFFSDLNNNGSIENEDEVLQIANYYPFGMIQNEEHAIVSENDHLFSAKELQKDLNLNLYDFGARYYDPALARWNSVDPKSNEFPNWSPYNYVNNNPMRLIDPNGENPGDPYKQLMDLVSRVFEQAPMRIAEQRISSLRSMMDRNDIAGGLTQSNYFSAVQGVDIPLDNRYVLNENEMKFKFPSKIYGNVVTFDLRFHRKKYKDLTNVSGIEFDSGRLGKGTSQGTMGGATGYLVRFYNAKNTVLTLLVEDKSQFKILESKFYQRINLHFDAMLKQDPQLSDFYKMVESYQDAMTAYRRWVSDQDNATKKTNYERATQEYETIKDEYRHRWGIDSFN